MQPGAFPKSPLALPADIESSLKEEQPLTIPIHACGNSATVADLMQSPINSCSSSPSRRACGHHHPQSAACRQCDHDGIGGATDGGSRTIAARSTVRVAIITGAGGPRLLRRRRPVSAQAHDQGAMAAPASGLRSRSLHAAPVAPADHRRSRWDGLRRRLRDRHQHGLHHRLRRCRFRATRSAGRLDAGGGAPVFLPRVLPPGRPCRCS